MANRIYFYKDEQGKTNKFIYCSRCQDGPFKHEDRDKFTEYDFGYNVYYCTKCSSSLNLGEPVKGFGQPLHSPQETRNPLAIEKSIVDSIVEKLDTPEGKQIVVNTDINAISKKITTYSKTIIEKPPVILPKKVTDKKPVEKEVSTVSKEKPNTIHNTGIYYVYILECSNGSYLSGIAPDLESPLNTSSVDSKKLPVELVLYKKFDKVKEAEVFLKRIKKSNNECKLILIKNFEKEYLNRTF